MKAIMEKQETWEIVQLDVAHFSTRFAYEGPLCLHVLLHKKNTQIFKIIYMSFAMPT